MSKQYDRRETPINTEINSAEQCEGIGQAVRRFEKIMMSRIYLQQRLGDRLKNSIRTGMIVLFLIAVSILVLLITLTVQVKKVAGVTDHINMNFEVISQNMVVISQYMNNMEKQVSLMPNINGSTENINQTMFYIKDNMTTIKDQVGIMNSQLNNVDQRMNAISGTVKQVDANIGGINYEVHRMSKPASTFNKFNPF